MAKKQDLTTSSTTDDSADAADAPDAPATSMATPENTPVPGGGSWHWDATLPGWAENAPYSPPPLAPANVVAPVSTVQE